MLSVSGEHVQQVAVPILFIDIGSYYYFMKVTKIYFKTILKLWNRKKRHTRDNADSDKDDDVNLCRIWSREKNFVASLALHTRKHTGYIRVEYRVPI